jgi:hypothetical protein
MDARHAELKTLFGKECRHLFRSPLALISVLFFLLGCGIPHYFPLGTVTTDSFSFTRYLSRIPFVAILLFPVLTMGLWTNERRGGTDAILFSMPVSDLLIVSGKFTAVFALYLSMLLLSLPVAFTLPVYPGTGILLCSYSSLMLYGALSLSAGLLVSVSSPNQAVAFLVTAVLLLAFNTIQLLPGATALPAAASFLCSRLSFAWHFETASRGILDSRDILFFILPTAACLGLSSVLLGRRRYRS